MSQGDFIAGCVVTHPATDLCFLEKRSLGTTSDHVSYTPRSTKPEGRKFDLLSRGGLSEIVVLSYSCDIDKVLANIADGRPANVSEVCLVAPVRAPRAFSDRVMEAIQRDEMANVLFVQHSDLHAEGVIDFSALQFVNMRMLLRSVAERGAALTPLGQEMLLERLAFYLGSKGRREQAAQQDDVSLLNRALGVLGLQTSAQ